MNKRSTGTHYETVAARFLELQGMEILERNYRSREGEIDLIAYDPAERALCFEEVKYRSDLRFGYPSEAVTPAKCSKIRLVSRHYLMQHPPEDLVFPVRGYRYDIVEIVGNRIRILKNAF